MGVDTRRRSSGGSAAGSGGHIGLDKETIRRLALSKLAIVYRDWNLDEPPFADFATEPGERRDDARAFIIALVAGLLGGISDAIEKNNEALDAALGRRRRPAQRRSRACPRDR